jgi:class 3 adenylate cyclase
MNAEIDIRHVLPTITVPTLVLYRADESWRAGARFMGERIPGARVVELPGDDHLPWEGDREALLDEIERFLSGAQEEVEPDRVLATLLFVDAAQPHHHVVRAQLARFRGRLVESPAGAVLALFDGPARAVRCAAAIARELDVRTGVHTGEIEQANGGVRGVAVQIVGRIAEAARPGEVVVSSTVKDIVAGSGITFEERGEQELDGAGTWRLFAAAP